MTRVGLLVALALAVVVLAGCGLGAGDEQEGGAELTITRDFGTRFVGHRVEHSIPADQTVMRMLQKDFDVTTRYGGGFVQSINGIAGGHQNGQPVDWFFYVNGIEASDGAAAHTVHADDRVWWDNHVWGPAQRVPAVVGSFPEPFLSGTGGKKLPVRLECADDARANCDEVAKRLENVGVTVTGRAAIGGIGSTGVLKIVVGRWSEVRNDPAVRQIDGGPKTSGVYVKPSPDGGAFALLDPDGKTARTLEAGSGLVAATRMANEAPTWVVTGTDAVGVAAAAASFTQASLSGRFAIAVEDGRPVRLPVVPPSDAP
jgi:hypothetical protein